MSPEELWDNFIRHLNVVQPLGKRDEVVEHKSFIGSIASYRKVFLEANDGKLQNPVDKVGTE